MSRALLSILLLPLFSLSAACSSSATPSGEALAVDPAAVDSGPSAPEADAGPSGSDASVDARKDPDEACGAVTTMKACVACCDTGHTDPSYAAALLACTCDLQDPDSALFCYTNCKTTACSAVPKVASETCGRCQQGSVAAGGACAAQITKACAGNADCAAHQACVASCSGKLWE